MTVHGAFGRWRATPGGGTTSRPSRGLWHGFDGSSDAAPKQRGALEARWLGEAGGSLAAVVPTIAPTARSAHRSARRRGPLESIAGRHRPLPAAADDDP